MERWRGALWVKAGIVCAVMVLPFGTLILTAMAAHRALRRRPNARSEDDTYEEWRRLREHMRAHGNGATADGARPPVTSAPSDHGDRTTPRS